MWNGIITCLVFGVNAAYGTDIDAAGVGVNSARAVGGWVAITGHEVTDEY